MPDSRRRLDLLDRLGSPELWPEIRRRASELRSSNAVRRLETERPGPPLRRRISATAVALIVAVSGIALAANAFLRSGLHPSSAGAARVTLSPPSGTSSNVLDAASEILQARLDAARIDASSSVRDGVIVVTMPAQLLHGEAPDATLELITAAGLFELRPVLAVVSPSDAVYDRQPVTCRPGDSQCDQRSMHRSVVFLDPQHNKYDLGPTVLSNDAIASAGVAPESSSQGATRNIRQVGLTLTPEGTDQFSTLSSEMVGQRLAFVVDELVLSASVVQAPITSGTLVIPGGFARGFTPATADTLAVILNAAPLPVPLSVANIAE
jgi:preprotein translocase subunit SecD